MRFSAVTTSATWMRGPNTNIITVRATPTGASATRDYTITVTRTTTPRSSPGALRAARAGDQHSEAVMDRAVFRRWHATSRDTSTEAKDEEEADGLCGFPL